MGETRPPELTELLNSVARGEAGAAEALWPILYGELHRLAGAHMAREGEGHTLQPTALVNEAFLRLVQAEPRGYPSRKHFFGLAARVMRGVLVDHARAKKSDKRGGGGLRLSLDERAGEAAEAPGLDALELEEALEDLARLDGELARIVVLRFFGGLSMDEIAEAVDLPKRTVERRWSAASAWLRDRLEG